MPLLEGRRGIVTPEQKWDTRPATVTKRADHHCTLTCLPDAVMSMPRSPRRKLVFLLQKTPHTPVQSTQVAVHLCLILTVLWQLAGGVVGGLCILG
jgi:hypothetical protein